MSISVTLRFLVSCWLPYLLPSPLPSHSHTRKYSIHFNMIKSILGGVTCSFNHATSLETKQWSNPQTPTEWLLMESSQLSHRK